MTKTEQAAKLLAELKEMAGSDATAMTVVAKEEAMWDGAKPPRQRRKKRPKTKRAKKSRRKRGRRDDPIEKDIRDGRIGSDDFTDDSKISLETFVTIEWTDAAGQDHNHRVELEKVKNRFKLLTPGAKGRIIIEAKLILEIDWFWSNPQEIDTRRFIIPFSTDKYNDHLTIGQPDMSGDLSNGQVLENISPHISVSVGAENMFTVKGEIIVHAHTYSQTDNSGRWSVTIGYTRAGGKVDGGYQTGGSSQTTTRSYKDTVIGSISPYMTFKLKPVKKKLRIVNSDPVNFEQVNQSELSNAERREVKDWWNRQESYYGRDLMHKILVTGQYYFEIAGHTDAQGAPNYNRSLSEKRANNVCTYLKEIIPQSGLKDSDFKRKFSVTFHGEVDAQWEDSVLDRKVSIKFVAYEDKAIRDFNRM